MTCIVGVAERGRVWLGGDAACVDLGWGLIGTVTAPKVFRLGELVMGYTTSFRMGQILQYGLSVPAREEGQGDWAWLVTQLVPAIQKALGQAGWLKQDQGRQVGGEVLIGLRGGLYRLQDDFGLTQTLTAHAAIGCGETVAMGALAVLRGQPETRIRRALGIVADLNAYVRAPFEVVHA